MKLSEISTPALILDNRIMRNNLKLALERTAELGISVRAHYKSSRAPWLGVFMTENGCKGLCCSTVGEAEDCAEAGVKDILIANALVTPYKIRRAAALGNKTMLTVCVDTADNILQYEKAAAEEGTKLCVYVEMNVGQNRCGVNTKEEVLALAKLVTEQPHLSFRGIQAYEGHISHEPDEEKAYEISLGIEKLLKETKAYLESNGIRVEEVSGLSTSSMSLRRRMGGTVYTEAQCGSFLFMGDEYKDIHYPPFESSLFLLTTVVSTKPDAFHTDGGMKTVSVDNGKPVIVKYPECEPVMSEEHMSHFMANQPYKPGDQVVYLPGHCCTTVNLHDRMYLFEGDEVLEEIEIKSRGKSQ